MPAGDTGRSARRPLERLLALPESYRIAALPVAFHQYEKALGTLTGDAATLHDQLRAIVRDRHPELLQDSAFAQVVEAPYRRADMLSWLLRENVGRMERLGSEMAHQAAETERLQGEISRLEAERQVMARELDHHRALADIGLMAAGVAHDFNNLLQVIAGHTAMVRGALSPEHPERDSLDKAISATQRASEMSRRLLSWARHESGAPQPVILGDMAAEVLDLIAASAPPKVLLNRALPPGLPPVLAEATDVRRIVLNLVVNAWQAIGSGPGEVRVSTGLSESGESFGYLEVQDDGCGMSDETRLRVFDPFFTTRAEGYGLGLPMVGRLVERHGGKLEVWSQPGHGARFRVSLPLAPASGSRVSDAG